MDFISLSPKKTHLWGHTSGVRPRSKVTFGNLTSGPGPRGEFRVQVGARLKNNLENIWSNSTFFVSLHVVAKKGIVDRNNVYGKVPISHF